MEIFEKLIVQNLFQLQRKAEGQVGLEGAIQFLSKLGKLTGDLQQGNGWQDVERHLGRQAPCFHHRQFLSFVNNNRML